MLRRVVPGAGSVLTKCYAGEGIGPSVRDDKIGTVPSVRCDDVGTAPGGRDDDVTAAAALLEALPHLVWTAAPDGSLTSVNAHWTTYTGRTREELLGWGWTAVLTPEHRDTIVGRWKADVARGSPVVERRFRCRRADGSYGWLLWRAAPVRNGDTIVGWAGTHTEIDGHIRLERMLSWGDDRFPSILETTQEGVLIIDDAGIMRYANLRCGEMLGFPPHELIGRSAFSLFSLEDQPGFAGELERRRRGEAATREDRLLRRDGSICWTITAASPIYDDAGANVGSIAMLTDISDRKAMEIRLAAAASEYASMTEATPQIMWSAQPDGAFDFVNGRWTEYTGIAREDARQWGWIPAIHRDDTAQLLVAWRTAIDRCSLHDATLRLRSASDGSYRWHLMRARPLVGESGAVVRWFGTFTDIHDERRTSRQSAIIARTGAVLAESLDRDTLLTRLASLVCEELAPFVLIGLVDERGALRIAGSAHRDPVGAAALRRRRGRVLTRRAVELLAAAGVPAIEPGADDVDRDGSPLDDRSVGSPSDRGSLMTAPLQTRGRTIGSILAFSPHDPAFGDDEARIVQEIAARAALAIENAELYSREHHVSLTLQQALLTTHLPTIAGLDFDAFYEPGATEAQIGGDWYDAVQLADGRVLVSIGDVTGRGVRAAVIMGRVRQAIETLADYESDPAALLDAADTVLRRSHPDALVTALVGVIDLPRQTFTYASAGHPSPVLRANDDHVGLLPASGLPLGLRDADRPPSATIALPAQSLLLLYTDGLTESTHDVIEGERRLLQAVRDPRVAASPHPAAAVKAAVIDGEAHDDIAVFAIRIGLDRASSA